METAKDSIKYIKPVYSKTASGRTLEDKSTSGTNTFEDASKYKDVWNDFNEDKFPRALYETTEDRITQELINVKKLVKYEDDLSTATTEVTVGNTETKIAFVIPVTADPAGNPAVYAGKLLRGYTTLYWEDETKPIATENKRTGTFFINKEQADALNITEISYKEKDGYVAVYIESSSAIGAAKDKLKCFARFDLEDDFLGNNLGEIELVMSDYTFQPRPTSIGVTWSQLAEITLDASFGLSAQDMLVTYAGDAIKINLDLRAFKIAYAIAKSNKNYLVEFDANYQNAATIEGYFHTAQTFPSALDTVTDNMVNDFMIRIVA